MRTFARIALLAAATGVLSISAAVPGQAHSSRYYYRHHVMHHHGHGYGYAYAPRRYRESASTRNERNCMRSPGSLRYEPCLNRH